MNDQDDELEGRVKKLEERADKSEIDFRGLKEETSWLRRLLVEIQQSLEDLKQRIKSAGGYLSNIGKRGSDDK
jgi:hypothetical protein